MAVFGLLHGAFEGAWCWEPLVAELSSLGHAAVAVDLPIDDVAAGWDDHVDVALEAFDDSDTIVVAHSRSGRMVPRLLERGPYADVVMLATSLVGGLRPPPYSTAPQQPNRLITQLPREVDAAGRSLLSRQAAELVFSDCTDAQIAWALANVRPQHELAVPPESQWRPARVSYICGTDDRVVDPTWARRACPDRLGTQAFTVPGGHSLFMSKPAALAARLDLIALGRPVQ